MNIRKFAATAIMTIAATGIAGGTAYADVSVEDTAAAPDKGVDHGVAYDISRQEGSGTFSMTLEGGTFAIRDGRLSITNAAGTEISNVALTVTTEEGQLDLQPTVTDNGTRLTATPVARWLSQRQLNIETGSKIGSAIGGLVGMIGILGYGVLALITMPVGMIIGGLIGAGIGAAIPASDEPNILELTCNRWSCH
ncbi:hypothetical protein [Nocardia huaxiensis]|uniref:DUF8020 domain-containing protein n=1 Tax=Nocardia huaxiensis TaxID=2755382 RepID=A0A7D6ZF89_9NOCA|nr:hypothetical protein [Nocardia huaxiensis]QLY32178.1 hypothetical protein H0264_07855 [Nocardia huaxiensis]UFS94122.1 hypothetical protein LPY97_25540 [Nocardia huaxiensis]